MLFVICIVVGVSEVFALEKVLYICIFLPPLFFGILAVVCIVLFIIESIKAKREARTKKEGLTILFIIAITILFINIHFLYINVIHRDGYVCHVFNLKINLKGIGVP